MSYFDHVRCHACKAMLDPESLGGAGGQGLVCPRCGAALDLKALFGLNAAFDEEEEGPVSLDDLVPRGSKPAPAPAPAPARKPAPAPARKPSSTAKPSSAGKPSSTALVHQPTPAPDSGDDDPPAAGSALEALRSLKKKKR